MPHGRLVSAAGLLVLVSLATQLSLAASLAVPLAPPSMLRCIVTGGSSGIGEAICKELGKRKCKVFITGRSVEGLERSKKSVEEAGGQASCGAGDVSSERDVMRLYGEAVSWFGGERPGCDLLVMSAGIGRFGEIETLTAENFDETMNTNVKGVWLWSREAIPAMKAQKKGQVIFVSSVAGLRKFARCSLYGTSKWAVEGLAGSLREECKGTGVKIATLAPGSVATPWWMDKERGGKDQPAAKEQLDKMLQPSDVATAAMTIVDQAPSSNIESLVLDPAA